eukprot:2662048-Amphidinium_carterae.1
MCQVPSGQKEHTTFGGRSIAGTFHHLFNNTTRCTFWDSKSGDAYEYRISCAMATAFSPTLAERAHHPPCTLQSGVSHECSHVAKRATRALHHELQMLLTLVHVNQPGTDTSCPEDLAPISKMLRHLATCGWSIPDGMTRWKKISNAKLCSPVDN